MGQNLLVEVQKLKAFASNPQEQRRHADVAGCVATAQQMGSKITVDKILSSFNEEVRNGEKG